MTHLANDFTEEELASIAARLESRDIGDPREVQEAIDILGDTLYRPAQSVIESYLGHPDPFVRAESIRALASWFKCEEHEATCERIISEETDFDARIAAISGLGSLALEAKNSTWLKTLAKIVRDPAEKRGHRETAYAGILYFRGVHPREHPHLTRSDQEFETAVDWDLISRIEAGSPL